ncbi:MAG: efflux RND transporter periplasmic adaptor subunit, partial [Myxococcota bacterium]
MKISTLSMAQPSPQPSQVRRSTSKSISLAASVLMVTFAASCSGDEEKPAPLVRAVRWQVVANADGAAQRVFSGALQAGNESRLSFQVGGRVKQVPVRTGQRVKKGALVAELDATDYQLQLREAQAGVAQARAQASAADASYKRVRRLYETQNTSRQDLDSARAERDTSRAALAAAGESLARARRQLGYARLEAPASGTINNVAVEANEVIGAGQMIAVLQAGEALEAAVDVPETFVRLVGLGDPAKVKISALTAEVEGVIQEIGVPEGTGVFPLRVKLLTEPETARPGMVAEVVLSPRESAQQAPEGVLVPLSAIGEDRDGRHAFLVDGEPGGLGKVRRVPITTGVIGANGIQ